jgi:uncharacterized membrane protein YeaQ/YmgE (transglycosylase-associated protein family)
LGAKAAPPFGSYTLSVNLSGEGNLVAQVNHFLRHFQLVGPQNQTLELIYAIIRNIQLLLLEGKRIMFAAIAVLAAILNPGGIVAWIVVGLIAGLLASAVMRGGYGFFGDIIVGIVGAFLGGLVMDVLAPDASFGFWGSVVVAFIGACILIAILRAISGSRGGRRRRR